MEQFLVHFILKFNIKRILDEIFKLFCRILLQLKKIKTITFLNSIIFKNRFLENYAYHIEIKKYVPNIFQQRKKKYIKRKKKFRG